MKAISSIAYRCLIIFILLFIITVPYPYYIIPDIGGYMSPYFEPLIRWVGKYLLGIKGPFTSKVISDATGMYIHCLILLTISLFISVLYFFFNKRKITRLNYLLNSFISYYLALQLLIYGLAKVFKTQFYLPEPNTLYTPLGQLHKDILFWSTMGASRGYSIFLGIAEIIPAILLLHKRTRGIGAILAMLVMANVVAINFSFDISVKVFSMFLLLISSVLAGPEIKRIYYLIIHHTLMPVSTIDGLHLTKRQIPLYAMGKSVVIGVILLESFFIYFRTINFNDDNAARPILHGAYQVNTFVMNNDTIPAISTQRERFKRIFIHRKGYFISQGMSDEMNDYELITQPAENKLILKRDAKQSDFNYNYRTKDSMLILTGKLDNKELQIMAKKLDLNKLPLNEKGFHWTIDGYQVAE